MSRFPQYRSILLLAAALAAIGIETTLPSRASAELPAVATRQLAEKKNFTDSEIVEGFFKTAFGLKDWCSEDVLGEWSLPGCSITETIFSGAMCFSAMALLSDVSSALTTISLRACEFFMRLSFFPP